jgi:hypothetical protein
MPRTIATASTSITTEHHPRDFNNSIYHGFVSGGRIHRSDGTIVDDDILASPVPAPTELTLVPGHDALKPGLRHEDRGHDRATRSLG